MTRNVIRKSVGSDTVVSLVSKYISNITITDANAIVAALRMCATGTLEAHLLTMSNNFVTGKERYANKDTNLMMQIIEELMARTDVVKMEPFISRTKEFIKHVGKTKRSMFYLISPSNTWKADVHLANEMKVFSSEDLTDIVSKHSNLRSVMQAELNNLTKHDVVELHFLSYINQYYR